MPLTPKKMTFGFGVQVALLTSSSNFVCWCAADMGLAQNYGTNDPQK